MRAEAIAKSNVICSLHVQYSFILKQVAKYSNKELI